MKNIIIAGCGRNGKTTLKYDTEDEWTYSFDDDELREFSKMSVDENATPHRCGGSRIGSRGRYFEQNL